MSAKMNMVGYVQGVRVWRFLKTSFAHVGHKGHG